MPNRRATALAHMIFELALCLGTLKSSLVPTLRVGTLCLTLCVARVAQTADDLGLSVPPGFAVSLYADDDLAHDIYSMTIDAKGRVAVAGRNYVKILHDDNADGRADRATLFSNKPASGAHGMYFDGPDLVCTGDDSVMRLRDTNDDSVADGKPEIWSRLRHPEHGANGVVKGPDGWFYVICGNDAEVTEKHASTPHSPVKKPNCGAIVRFSPDGKQSEIFAHGFRNPYDLDFNEHGHLFTVDADGERDQYLPWYAPNRLFDVAQGMHHGWVLRGWTRSWNRPEYFPDSVERLVEIGRGSPTGLVCYRHRAFPPKYRGGIFSACWTLGNIYYFPLTPKGSTYTSQKEIFLRPTGQTGFAPVDLAVGPAGDMFIAIGGRGTRGGVFRVGYLGPRPPEPAVPVLPAEPLQVLDADQPLTSWSRANWVPIAKELGANAMVDLLDRTEFTTSQRVRAVEVVTELFGGLRPIQGHKPPGYNPALEARAIWSVARWIQDHAHDREARSDSAVQLFGYSLGHPSPAVQRAAWESVAGLMDADWARLGLSNTQLPFWFRSLTSDERRIRVLSVTITREHPLHRASLTRAIDGWIQLIRKQPALIGADADKILSRLQLADCGLNAADEMAPRLRAELVEQCLLAIAQTRDETTRLEAMRWLQIIVGDVRIEQAQPDLYAGYAPRDVDSVSESTRHRIVRAILRTFPQSSRVANWEAARVLSMLAVDEADAPLQNLLALGKDSAPEDDIHYLIVLSRLPGARSPGVTLLAADTLVRLHMKMNLKGFQVSRNWPLVVGELFDELCKRDAALATAVANHPDFGLADHTLFAERMPKELRNKAARKIFDSAIKARDNARWSAEMVALIGHLPDADVLPKIRELWEDEPGLRDAIAVVLARSPVDQDRSRLVTALISPDPKTIVAAAKALRALAKPGQPGEIADALRMLREYCVPGKHAEVRRELTALLSHWTDQKIHIDERNIKNLRDAYQPWFDWFAKAHPQQAAKLAASGEIDAAAWAKRLTVIDFSAGEAARGRKIFDARSCNRCHGAGSRLGPDLAGVTRRFSRADLLTSIIDPNKDVSPLYQTTQLTTKTGQTHVGILIYESPESSLVQTGPDTTIRITDEDVSKRRPSRQSLMPTGLLNAASDQDIADLFAYMQSTDAK
jgi:putative membrane-bound dehydrogenase-like protein